MRRRPAATVLATVLLASLAAAGVTQKAQPDASSAGSGSQLTLAAAPAPSQEAVVVAPAPEPAAELQSSLALPAAGPSSELLLASGTLVQLQGQVAALSQWHADSRGSSVVNITVSGLLANYSQTAAACAFVPLGDVQRLQAQSLQWTSSPDFLGRQDLLTQYVQLVMGQSAVNATLAFSPNSNCTTPSKCPRSGAYNFTVLCGVPAGDQAVVPAVLAYPPQNDDSNTEPVLVSPGGATLAMQRVMLNESSPGFGPASGNTTIVIRGAGFEEGLRCAYVNGTAQPPAWLYYNATVHSSGVATCDTPAWPLGNATTLSVGMQLAWPDSTSLVMPNFVYYSPPTIAELSPPSLPRFGDESTVVYAFFASGFANVSQAQLAALEPRLRLTAPGVSGSSTVLTANWTADLVGLQAVLPSGGQLAAGQYIVQASLNGGHDYSGGIGAQPAALEVEGPLVGMSAAYHGLPAGETQVQLSMALNQPPSLPVTATASLEQRTAAGVSQVSLPADVLVNSQVSWAAGNNSTQNFTLKLPQGQSWSDCALLVSVTAASNADIDPLRAATIVSSAPASDFLVTFDAGYNQVVYPGQNASIPVNITGGRISAPAAVSYTLVPQTPLSVPFLPSVDGSLEGELRWDPANGDQTDIAVPIEWSQVPMAAIYRLGATLLPAWNANVTDHRWQAAVHIFGVDQGTCPPGTYLKTAPGSGASNVSRGNLTAGAPARLRDLHLLKAGGQSIELSTQFEPNTTVYGAMVPMDTPNATLCVDPAKAGARVTVFNGTNDVMQPVDVAATAAVSTFASNVPGRRLRGMLGVRPADCGAGQLTYLLPFALGQNDFDVFITSPAAAAAQAPAAASYGKEQAALKQPGNTTVRYSLSVVRLADPTHCELESLNATTAAGRVLPVCGVDAAAAANASAAAAAAVAASPAPELEAAGLAQVRQGYGPCKANAVAGLNVTSGTDYLSLHPGLRFPNIQGVRVEVNGQVLSQGGNLGADRITDTTSAMQVRQNPDFLPAAVIVGLEPGVPLQVPIVIIAEDGVTSLRYYVSVTRDLPSNTTDKAAPAGEPSAEDNLLAGSPLAAIFGNITKANLSQLGLSPNSSATSSDAASASAISPSAAAMAGDSQQASAAASSLWGPLPAGWPSPPARQQQCGACVGGWASTAANASYCTMCGPGSYSPAAFSPACAPCLAGTYASSWGSTHCKHCVTGTYGPSEGGQLCLMCPANYTTLADGSTSCNTPVGQGLDLSTRYAVIVSFGVLLNGTALDEIASTAGVNASSLDILDTLVRSDTASAFNISLGDVQVTGVEQLARRVLYVNVSASLPVDVPPGASDDDVRTAFNVKSISADEPIKMLVEDPDKFFGRTTKALNVNAEGDGHGAQRTLSVPRHGRHLVLPWYAILGIILGGLVVIALATAVFARRRTRRAYQAVAARFSGMRLPQFRASAGGWRLPAAWGMVQRIGSGSSAGSAAPSEASASGAPGGARPRHHSTTRSMMQGPYSDAASDAA